MTISKIFIALMAAFSCMSAPEAEPEALPQPALTIETVRARVFAFLDHEAQLPADGFSERMEGLEREFPDVEVKTMVGEYITNTLRGEKISDHELRKKIKKPLVWVESYYVQVGRDDIEVEWDDYYNDGVFMIDMTHENALMMLVVVSTSGASRYPLLQTFIEEFRFNLTHLPQGAGLPEGFRISRQDVPAPLMRANTMGQPYAEMIPIAAPRRTLWSIKLLNFTNDVLLEVTGMNDTFPVKAFVTKVAHRVADWDRARQP